MNVISSNSTLHMKTVLNYSIYLYLSIGKCSRILLWCWWTSTHEMKNEMKLNKKGEEFSSTWAIYMLICIWCTMFYGFILKRFSYDCARFHIFCVNAVPWYINHTNTHVMEISFFVFEKCINHEFCLFFVGIASKRDQSSSLLSLVVCNNRFQFYAD